MINISEFNYGFIMGILIIIFIQETQPILIMFQFGFLTGFTTFLYLDSITRLDEISNTKFRNKGNFRDTINNRILTYIHQKRYQDFIKITKWLQKRVRIYLKDKKIVKIQSLVRRWLTRNGGNGYVNSKMELFISTNWKTIDNPFRINYLPKKDFLLVKDQNIRDQIQENLGEIGSKNIWLIRANHIILESRLSVLVLPKGCKNYDNCLCQRCLNYRKYRDRLNYSHANPYSIRRIKIGDCLLGYLAQDNEIVVTRLSLSQSSSKSPDISCFDLSKST